MITKTVQVVTEITVATDCYNDEEATKEAVEAATDLVEAAMEKVAYEPEKFIRYGSIEDMKVLTETKVLYQL